MTQRQVTVVNETGIHGDYVYKFVSFVNKFPCKVYLVKGTQVANAKSILNVIMLNLGKGVEVCVQIEGSEKEYEECVLDEIISYILHIH